MRGHPAPRAYKNLHTCNIALILFSRVFLREGGYGSNNLAYIFKMYLIIINLNKSLILTSIDDLNFNRKRKIARRVEVNKQTENLQTEHDRAKTTLSKIILN